MAREPDWGHLRRRLFKSAASRGMPARDVDDVVQEAIYKILKRGKWSEETLETYLFRALRDKEAEYWRSKDREVALAGADNDDKTPDEQLEEWTPPRPEPGFDFVLTESAVRQTLDEDAMAYAVLHAMGFTGRQIARRLDWPLSRVEAARVKLARKKGAVALAVLEQLPEHIKREVPSVD